MWINIVLNAEKPAQVLRKNLETSIISVVIFFLLLYNNKLVSNYKEARKK